MQYRSCIEWGEVHMVQYAKIYQITKLKNIINAPYQKDVGNELVQHTKLTALFCKT